MTQTERAEEDCIVNVPSSISLNDADKLFVEISCPVSEFHFRMYNRWGELLYETQNFTAPLDLDLHAHKKGKGKKLGPKIFNGNESYIWQMDYREEGTVNTRKANGTIIVLN